MSEESLKSVEDNNTISTDEDIAEFTGWKGMIHRIYDAGDAPKIFSFLSDALKKKDLFDAFSVLTNGPKMITNEDMKTKLSKLSVDYGFVEPEGERWRPKRYTPYELTRTLKRIFRRENAPEELMKRLNQYMVSFLGDQRTKQVSEIVYFSEPLDYSYLGKIEEFFKERGLDPNSIILGSKFVHGSFLTPFSAPYSNSCKYSLKCPGLAYSDAEELAHLLEDKLSIKNIQIIFKRK